MSQVNSLTAGAFAEAEGASLGAEDPQTQVDLPEVAEISGNVCFSLVVSRVRQDRQTAGEETIPYLVFIFCE